MTSRKISNTQGGGRNTLDEMEQDNTLYEKEKRVAYVFVIDATESEKAYKEV